MGGRERTSENGETEEERVRGEKSRGGTSWERRWGHDKTEATRHEERVDDDGDDDDDNSWQGPLSTAAKPNESEMALGSPECGGRTAFGGRRGDEVVAEEREEDAAKFADATDKDGKFTRTESAREREGRNQRISAPDEGQRASEVNSDLERVSKSVRSREGWGETGNREDKGEEGGDDEGGERSHQKWGRDRRDAGGRVNIGVVKGQKPHCDFASPFWASTILRFLTSQGATGCDWLSIYSSLYEFENGGHAQIRYDGQLLRFLIVKLLKLQRIFTFLSFSINLI